MPPKPTRSAYRREGGETLIDIRLREVRQLFHTLDPSPFRERDLDDAAERYLVEACREAGGHRPLKLVVHLPEAEANSDAARTLPEAVHNYFSYREHQLRADIRQLLRYGAISLTIGLTFLIACLGLRRGLAGAPLAIDPAIINEGLLILGWVAMWRPTEALLYDWWPLARRVAILHRLSAIKVEVRATA